MKSRSTSVESLPKNEQATLREIHRVAEANQIRLQHLELAVANLTNICNALRNYMCSVGPMTVRASSTMMQEEARENKLSSPRASSPGIDLKVGVLGAQMQQLIDLAAGLGILKAIKNTPIKDSGDVKTSPKSSTKPSLKSVKACTSPKSSTRSLVQTRESSVEKKMPIKLAGQNIGATQTKGKTYPQIAASNKKTAATTQVSVKSTVRNTRTTISKVYVETATKRGNEISARSNVSLRSSVKNVGTVEGSGSIKLKNTADQGYKNQRTMKSLVLAKTNSSSDVKPRRRWSITEEITFNK